LVLYFTQKQKQKQKVTTNLIRACASANAPALTGGSACGDKAATPLMPIAAVARCGIKHTLNFQTLRRSSKLKKDHKPHSARRIFANSVFLTSSLLAGFGNLINSSFSFTFA
jgi:hypothetical protein